MDIMNTLNEKLEESRKLFSDVRFEDKHTYGCYLAQTYHYVKYSTRLICASMASMPPEMTQAFDRSKRHIQEEHKHEVLALNDIKALGLDIKDFPELPATKAMVALQFNEIQRLDPMAYYGYVLFLEALAVNVGKDFLARIEPAYGAKALSFLKVHAEEDQDHVIKCVEMINAMPESTQKVVLDNLESSAALFNLMVLSASKWRPA